MTHPDEHTGPTIRDRRRIDPDTYLVREARETAPSATDGAGSADDAASGAEQASPPSTEPSEVDQLTIRLSERTTDLQRLQAEYVNYKRRVDRDRDLARSRAVENVLVELLPVLDNVASAREHGELTGGFKAVAEEFAKVATRHGLESYGQAGDAFDPNIHEALMHAHAEGITGPTCVQILQPGYRVGDRILRPARVAVAEPAEPSAAESEPADPELAESESAEPVEPVVTEQDRQSSTEPDDS